MPGWTLCSDNQERIHTFLNTVTVCFISPCYSAGYQFEHNECCPPAVRSWVPDGTDREDKIIIVLVREMYIMFIVEDVVTYSTRKSNVAVWLWAKASVMCSVVLYKNSSLQILCAFCNTMCVCMCEKG